MKKFLLLLLIIGSRSIVQAQCNVTASASPVQITCGESTILSHAGTSQGNISFQEDFNNGATTGWAFTQQATFTNPCSSAGVDGTPHIWMGSQSAVPRALETNPLNFGPSVAPNGGTICFDMLFARQCSSCNAPCEGPDESDEGVYLQYSLNNGASWTTIHYFDPNGGNDPQLINWNNWCFPIPNGALVNGVKFRWFQDADSGADYDHWGIDNVEISVNDPNVTYTWPHDGYTTGQIGSNPTPVSPTTTTTYTVNMTTSTGNCTNTITVVVVPPVFHIDLGSDVTLCPGECVTLNAEAYEINSPASTPTFSNAQITPVTGGNASMNINVQGLNTTTLTNGSITSVCLNGFNFSGTQLCTSFTGCNCNGTHISAGSMCSLNISSFNVTLTAPGGCSITLVPAGTATGTNYTNVCFVPAGGQSITGGGFPAAGSWNPSQPFSNLNGCDANGTWTMTLNAPGGLGFGLGSLQGWSISFDDPEITEPVNYTWSPTTNMTNSTTLSPTICPTASTTYTLTVADTDGCATASDQIAINIGTCCDLEIDNIATVNPGCGTPNGQITVQYSGQITGLKFSIDGGATFQTSNVFPNLPAGTYQVQIIDDSNCPDNETVTLTNPNAPTLTSTTTPPACGGSDGTITVVPSGGTAPYQYSINGGTNQTSATFSGLAAGTHTVITTDANGCQDTETVTLTEGAGPVISSVTPTSPTCGASNGTLVINATGGTAPYEYSIDNGTTNQASNTFSNLGSATYPVLVTDANGCDVTQSVQLTTPNAPSIDDITLVHPPCGTTSGSITVVASGGVGTLNYSINNGTPQASAVFSNLAEGTYDVTVTDANGCEFDQTVTLTQGTGPVISSATPTNPSCNGTDGSIIIVASGGTAPLTYSVDGGTTTQANGSFTTLGDGTYNIVVEDANGCEATQTETLTEGPGPSITSVTPTAPNCGASDGAIAIVATGGTAPLTYSINGGTTTQASGTFNNLGAGSYNIVVEDANGCEATQTATLNTSSVPNVNAGADITICLGESVTLTATGANTYAWTEGVNNGVAFTPTVTTTYTVTGTDAAGCVNTDAVVVTVIPIPVAGFTPSVTSGDPVLDVVFTNTSTSATSYTWDFGNGSTPVITTSNAAQNASYSTPGVYNVTLVASNGNCTNTFSVPITVIGFPFDIHVPNVFTPNGDKSNDEFFIDVTNGKSIEVNIYNRWGNKMFDITDFTTKWDGKDAAEGVYFFTYTITGLNGEVREGQGHVTLIKK